ncbi:MAG: hypothetical protein QXE01_02960 [Sulfolobales archaeon]
MSPKVDPSIWARDRDRAYRRMIRDLYIGYLDPGVKDILEDLFGMDGYYPTSSCIGRIVAIDAPTPWRRRDSHVVMKKHSEIMVEEVEELLRIPVINILWLIASGPIFHVIARTPRHALALLKKAREAGFKHSGLLASSRRGYLVELVTGIWVDIPIKTADRILINRSEVKAIVDMLNNALREGRERLLSLKKILKELALSTSNQ